MSRRKCQEGTIYELSKLDMANGFRATTYVSLIKKFRFAIFG